MPARFCIRTFVFGSLAAFTLITGGCSKKGSEVTVTDSQGKQTIISGTLNAGLTNFSGDFRATISVKYPDESPATNLAYQLEYSSASSNAVVATGSLSGDGSAIIEGLAAANPPVLYSLTVDEQMLGMIHLGLNRDSNRFEFLLPAKAGMKAPALALRDLKSNQTFGLADLLGQIVLLDFYTTSCAPCQPVLSKWNDVLGRRAESWQGKVAVLAIGLDAVQQPNVPVELVAKHLSKKGWQRLRPLVPNEPFSWEPSKRSPFGVSGVPHSFIIGRDGTILWAGHPGSLDIEARIEELLKQGFQPNTL